MKKILIVILVIAGYRCSAQHRSIPTRFDKFVQNKNINWAAYTSDTIRFTSFNLNNLLVSRLQNKEIKASLPVESRTSKTNQIKYSPWDTIYKAYYGEDINQELGVNDFLINRQQKINELEFANFNLTEVTQILYIEKGKLKSYVPFVTPTLPVYLSTGNYIGERWFFTSCFNFSNHCKSGKKSKLIFLTQSKKIITLQPDKTNQLKEMYGLNLLETLWPQVLKNNIAVFSFDQNKIIHADSLTYFFTDNQAQLIPIANDNDNMHTYQVANKSLENITISHLQLVQDWYYDTRKNNVFSKMIELIVFVKTSNPNAQNATRPLIKLIFN